MQRPSPLTQHGPASALRVCCFHHQLLLSDSHHVSPSRLNPVCIQHDSEGSCCSSWADLMILPPFCFCAVRVASSLSFLLPSTRASVSPPSARFLYREEEFENGLEEEKDEETPVTESDSDEQEGATPRYFRTWWSRDALIMSCSFRHCRT